MVKIILIHGNGGGTGNDNWLPSLKDEFQNLGFEVLNPDFPDSDLARASIWLPFIEHELKADDQTVIVGHSSGAIAAMRYAEKHPLLGSVLVGSYYTDLGYEKEKQSGYFETPWNWDRIRKNQKWILQFASVDDKWIPIEEPRFIHQKLKTEYFEFEHQGHFGGDYVKKTFPECTAALKAKLHV